MLASTEPAEWLAASDGRGRMAWRTRRLVWADTQWHARVQGLEDPEHAYDLGVRLNTLLGVAQDVAEAMLARFDDPQLPDHMVRLAQAAAAADRAGIVLTHAA